MKTIGDHQTGDLFDPWADRGDPRRRLLERSWAGVFRKHLLEHLPVSRLARCFDGQRGRPTQDLHVAMGVLILPQLHDLTDAATVEALAFNIAWHDALDLRDGSDAYRCEKTLRNDRRLVIDQGLDEVRWRSLTDRLMGAFKVDPSRQRLDSTAIRSAMRNLIPIPQKTCARSALVRLRYGVKVERLALLQGAGHCPHAGCTHRIVERLALLQGAGHQHFPT